RPEGFHEPGEELGSAPTLVGRGSVEPCEEIFHQARELRQPGKPVQGRAASEPMRDDRQIVGGTGDGARRSELVRARRQRPQRLPRLAQEDVEECRAMLPVGPDLSWRGVAHAASLKRASVDVSSSATLTSSSMVLRVLSAPCSVSTATLEIDWTEAATVSVPRACCAVASEMSCASPAERLATAAIS